MDKRSLIWQLQSKVGQRFTARFAAKKALQEEFPEGDQAKKRRKALPLLIKCSVWLGGAG